MDLSNHHRSSLVSELQEALKEKESHEYMAQTGSAKNDLMFAEHIEIKQFLNNKKIEAIKDALIKNEINF